MIEFVKTKKFLIIFSFFFSVNFRIKIIGGGIGGASLAFFLKDLSQMYFTNPATPSSTIFERANRTGGRIYSIEYEGRIMEVGADAWATDNYELFEMVRKIGNETLPYSGGTESKRL